MADIYCVFRACGLEPSIATDGSHTYYRAYTRDAWAAITAVAWLCAHGDRPSVKTYGDNHATLYITSGRQKHIVRVIVKNLPNGERLAARLRSMAEVLI